MEMSAAALPPPPRQLDSHLVLPRPLGDLVRCLERQLAVPAQAGTALALQMLSAALGPAAQLIEGAATPVPAELSTLIITPPGCTVSLARQALLSPLLAVQDELWELAGDEPPSLLLSGSHTNPAEVRARQHPVVLLTAPTFDELQAAMARSFDGSLLVVHDVADTAGHDQRGRKGVTIK